ncbi:MAG: hypothetical protein AAB074_08525 [Planctomycetota bacterium]
MADMKEVMMEKGDKLALGAAVLLLVGYAAYAFGMSSDADLAALDAQVKQADQKIKTNPPPVREKVDFSATTKPWGAEASEKPEGKRNYVSMWKTKVTANIKGGGGPVVPTIKLKFLSTPVMGAPETELGQVKVKWTDSKVPPGEEAAAITEYEVFRQEAGKGWASLSKVKAREFMDNSVEPKKKYAYKVKSKTKDKLKEGMKPESEFSQVVEATVPSGVAIIYIGGSPQAVGITVRKFVGGQWKERKYPAVVPFNEERNQTGAIGKIEREKDPDTGKMVEVDYSTGFVLREIRKDRFKFKRIERRSKIVNGVLETEDVEVDAERDRMKILYTNDDGKPAELWIADEKDEENK